MQTNMADMISAYGDDFNHYEEDLMEKSVKSAESKSNQAKKIKNKEFDKNQITQDKINQTLSETEEDEKLKPALNTLKDLDENQKNIEEKEELILELSSPKEKQDFLKNTLENTKANEKLGESLDILEALDENAKLIKE
ncbi:hypothetical protein FDW45_06175, partial [Campylobacter helveticus]